MSTSPLKLGPGMLERCVLWIAHLLPFQNSASAGALGLFTPPTAMQALGEVQDTPLTDWT